MARRKVDSDSVATGADEQGAEVVLNTKLELYVNGDYK
jgi:hypothetical protein